MHTACTQDGRGAERREARAPYRSTGRRAGGGPRQRTTHTTRYRTEVRQRQPLAGFTAAEIASRLPRPQQPPPRSPQPASLC